MVTCGDATTIASFQRRVCVPRPQSRGGAGADLPDGKGLRGLREGAARGEGATADAFAGVVRAAEHWHLVLWPRADGDLSEFMRWLSVTHTRRWHSGAPHVGHGRVVPGTLQVLPEPGGRAPVDGVALCGAERLAREVGRIGGGVALVQPVASAQRRRRGVGGRGAGAVVAELAAACAVAAEGGRAGGAAAIGGAGNALRRGVLAGGNGQATALGIDTSPTWPPEEGSAGRGCQRDLRLPTPSACRPQ